MDLVLTLMNREQLGWGIAVYPFIRPIARRLYQPATVGVERQPLTPEQSTRAIRNWQFLGKLVRRHLKLRIKWAALGKYLDQPNLLSLTAGLDRVKGKLVRTAPADIALEQKVSNSVAKAAARAKARLAVRQ